MFEGLGKRLETSLFANAAGSGNPAADDKLPSPHH
jgi:hypothetical protein